MNFLLDSTLFVIDIHQNMPISLILTSFDYFQIRPSFAVTFNLILEPCHTLNPFYSVPVELVNVYMTTGAIIGNNILINQKVFTTPALVHRIIS